MNMSVERVHGPTTTAGFLFYISYYVVCTIDGKQNSKRSKKIKTNIMETKIEMFECANV